MLSVHTLPRTTFSILIVLAMRWAPALGADRSAGETRQEWAIKAHVLIDELLEISRDVAKTEQEANAITLRGERTGKHEEMMADLVLLTLQSWGIREKADGVLWKLWLTTGKVPTPQKKSKSLSANLSRNAREFRAYVTTHATATEEELVRLGLTNAAADAVHALAEASNVRCGGAGRDRLESGRYPLGSQRPASQWAPLAWGSSSSKRLGS